MATKSLVDAKTIYGGFSNDAEWHKIIYDFSVDGGSSSDDLILFTAGNNMVIVDFYANIESVVSSAGALVTDLGVSAGGTGFWSNKAVSAMTAGAVLGMDTAAPVRVASGSSVVMGQEAADAISGKIEYNFKIRKQ
jgi:hypothetical protein